MRKTVKSCGRQTAAHAGSARRLCVVGLEDGRVLIKKVQPSRDLKHFPVEVNRGFPRVDLEASLMRIDSPGGTGNARNVSW